MLRFLTSKEANFRSTTWLQQVDNLVTRDRSWSGPVTDIKPAQSAVRWHCRRGMLELDRLLCAFVDRHYGRLSWQQADELMRLLAVEDDLLWDWLSGRQPVTGTKNDSRMSELVTQIRQCGCD